MSKNQTTEKIKNVLSSGTMAGVLSALVLILLFILAATFLKSLAFGLILAYFCLPLEKFYEQKFFQWKWINALWTGISFITFPFLALQKRFCGEKAFTEEELKEKQRRNLVMRSTSCTVLTVLLVMIVAGFTLLWLLIPWAVKTGKSLKNNPAVLQMEKSVIKWTERNQASSPGTLRSASAAPQQGKDISETGTHFQTVRSFKEWFLPRVRKYVHSHQKELAKLMFDKGKGILSWLLSILAALGTIAFDILMSIVFFYFFLHKMALFMRKSNESSGTESETIGVWCVRSVFSTPWLPQVSSDSRQEAASIIDRIAFMLKKWARGYLWIMIIEITLYMLAFSLFSVPYGLLLAIPSGMTILLPLFGLIGNIALSVTICLIFCEEGALLGTLAGVLVSYLIINGILEQLFLYPTLVGNAIGLTLLETLVVVLLGGMLAGVSGMILAVPAAAVMKFLIPKIYSGLSDTAPDRRSVPDTAKQLNPEEGPPQVRP